MLASVNPEEKLEVYVFSSSSMFEEGENIVVFRRLGGSRKLIASFV